ncbi:MAG: Gfo/Idh/MocA family oxidoreductase [Verrucomicrobia bacterium]|nr:Gfo/Idh/MocA family oxidoreductase [Verrucomicrobiota bacterium]
MNTPTSFPFHSRREFIRTGSAAAAAMTLAFPHILRGATDSRKLKIGLVGCGGRGTGALAQALGADSNSTVSALADLFSTQIDITLQALSTKPEFTDRAKVPESRRFVGLDAFTKMMASDVDVVLLTTPPGFRPLHLAAAIAAGKHVFCEKPMATDAPGVRSVLESARTAKEKNLSIVAGFNVRYDTTHQEFMKGIHDGKMGDVMSLQDNRLGTPVKPMSPPEARPKEMGDVEWQLRNWYNFTWLSGDGLVEQAVHHVDRIMWVMQDVPPQDCIANGGRNSPNYEGNIYDHIDALWQWEGGMQASLMQRQVLGCDPNSVMMVHGTKGRAAIDLSRGIVPLDGKRTRSTYSLGPSYNNEHIHLFNAIRAGEAVNDGVRMAHSTLAAIMARMAAYTGKRITWDMAMNSKEKLVPDNLTWDMKLPITPMAIPGQTKFL